MADATKGPVAEPRRTMIAVSISLPTVENLVEPVAGESQAHHSESASTVGFSGPLRAARKFAITSCPVAPPIWRASSGSLAMTTAGSRVSPGSGSDASLGLPEPR